MSRQKGYVHSIETKLKISNSLKGIPKTIEHKKNMSLSQIGHITSEKTKLKISTNSSKYWLGKHRSEDTKQKLRLSNLGKKQTKETIEKIKNSRKGYRHSELTIQKMKGHHRKISEKQKQQLRDNKERGKKISNSLRGIPKSPEHRKKISEVRKQLIKEGKIVQKMPLQDTTIELKIQNFLKQLDIPYFSHYHINIEHAYPADFFIPSLKLVIESDGCYWHGCPNCNITPPKNINDIKIIDNQRTIEIKNKGYKIIRLWEHDIIKLNIEQFKEILDDIQH